MEIVWKPNTRQYSNSLLGFVGKWQCFEIAWNGSRSKNDTDPTHEWSLNCGLPGIKDRLGYFDLDGAKAKAAKVFEYWHKNLCAETPK